MCVFQGTIKISLFIAIFAINTCAYHSVVNELQSYVESNETFAKLLNETFIEASSSRNTITYTDMYIFFDSWITIIGNYSNSTFQTTLDKFCKTSTGRQLYVDGKKTIC